MAATIDPEQHLSAILETHLKPLLSGLEQLDFNHLDVTIHQPLFNKMMAHLCVLGDYFVTATSQESKLTSKNFLETEIDYIFKALRDASVTIAHAKKVMTLQEIAAIFVTANHSPQNNPKLTAILLIFLEKVKSVMDYFVTATTSRQNTTLACLEELLHHTPKKGNATTDAESTDLHKEIENRITDVRKKSADMLNNEDITEAAKQALLTLIGNFIIPYKRMATDDFVKELSDTEFAATFNALCYLLTLTSNALQTNVSDIRSVMTNIRDKSATLKELEKLFSFQRKSLPDETLITLLLKARVILQNKNHNSGLSIVTDFFKSKDLKRQEEALQLMIIATTSFSC